MGVPLDGLATQLLSFSEQVGARMDGLPHGSAMLKDLLRISWRSLIVGAVADSQQFFSAEFLQEIENSFPFRFGFLRARRTRFASREGLCSKLFDAFLKPPDDDDLDSAQLVVRFGQLLVVVHRGSDSKSTDQT